LPNARVIHSRKIAGGSAVNLDSSGLQQFTELRAERREFHGHILLYDHFYRLVFDGTISLRLRVAQKPLSDCPTINLYALAFPVPPLT
jgi:hypothetical protein